MPRRPQDQIGGVPETPIAFRVPLAPPVLFCLTIGNQFSPTLPAQDSNGITIAKARCCHPLTASPRARKRGNWRTPRQLGNQLAFASLVVIVFQPQPSQPATAARFGRRLTRS
jgi:hypothetical protein